jgi:anti-sigma28 factor (negative regulator of flagellin synthesis)
MSEPHTPDSGFPDVKRGAHPIIHPASDDDLSHMTVLELRYASRNRVSPRPASTRRRFGQDVHGDRVNTPPMTDSRMTKMEAIRAEIERETYTVDPGKVAEAIVARLLAGRSSRDAGK